MAKAPDSGSSRPVATVIMAAGEGKRMKDPTRAKVLYELNGKPMIHYVADLALELGTNPVVVIVGHQRQLVISYLGRSHPMMACAVQAEQLGTGHAVMQAEPALKGFSGDVVVLSGDVPLLTRQTMEKLIAHHRATSAVATILTAIMQDPTGYGRMIRNADGSVKRIVEHRDATDAERAIKEMNSGIYVFDKERLFEALKSISPDNTQREYYLTDVFEFFWKNNWTVSALVADSVDEIHGINSFEQLEQARRILASRSEPR
jgi:UDP-N-acetylglucosamine diphosphorylase/glucosamine-1-phosphate N-acetyltransferase